MLMVPSKKPNVCDGNADALDMTRWRSNRTRKSPSIRFPNSIVCFCCVRRLGTAPHIMPNDRGLKKSRDECRKRREFKSTPELNPVNLIPTAKLDAFWISAFASTIRSVLKSMSLFAVIEPSVDCKRKNYSKIARSMWFYFSLTALMFMITRPTIPSIDGARYL